MEKLVIHGDPGIRKGARIRIDGDERVCFGISRQGEYHGPEEVQLWCTVGTDDERDRYERREFVPLHLDTRALDADEIEVVDSSGG